MRKSWLLCVLLGTLAWGQAAPGTPPPPQGGSVPGNASPGPGNMARPQGPRAAQPDMSVSVPPNAPVLTIDGVCPAVPKAAAAKGTAAKPATPSTTATKSAAAKTAGADCKRVITKAEFEKIATAVAPNVTPQLKKQLAGVLPRLIAMSSAAQKQGLDKTPRYEELVKFAKMQILTNELQRHIQEEAGKVPPAEIASYYKEHPESFEQYNLDRLFVPRTKQAEADEDDKDDKKDEKLTEEQQKAKQAEEKAKADEAEQTMAKLAESLRARAAAGEDFAKLQKDAFDAAGMKIESPTVNLPKVRHAGLPPAHAAVFELKAGEVSQVINDSGGHYIYKVNSKDTISLDQAKDEIMGTLKNQRAKEMMDKANGSFHVEPNEAYFGPGGGPGGPGAMPPPRGANPRVPPSPMAPAPQTAPPAQTPPPAQPPAAKPN